MTRWISIILIPIFLRVLGSEANGDYEPIATETITREEGRSVALTCEFTEGEENKSLNFEWRHEGQRIEATRGRFRVENMTKEGKKRLDLIGTNLQAKTDNGNYECIVADEKKIKIVNLVIIALPQWVNTDFVVSGGIGEPLEIDCDAKGTPEPVVYITNETENSFKNLFKRDKNSLYTVDKLTMEHKGFQIQCVAGFISDVSDLNPIITKIVTVDVFYKATFTDGNEVTQYGIPNSNLTIVCRVNDSNPPVHKFVFYELIKNPDILNPEEKIEITDGYKGYVINVVTETQTATLFIPSLNQSHFSQRFECQAWNKPSFQSSQFTTIVPFEAPGELIVTEKDHDDDTSIIWQLQNSGERPAAEPPATGYRIKYVLDDKLNDTDWDEVQAHHFSPSVDCTYKISGLEKVTRYTFRFQAVNIAGEGIWTELKTSTRPKKPINSGASGIFQSAALLLAIFIFWFQHFVIFESV